VTTRPSARRIAPRASSGSFHFAVDIRPKLLFNPDSVPRISSCRLTAILLLNVTHSSPLSLYRREKERGTLEQLFVTRSAPWASFRQLLPYLAIGFPTLSDFTFMRFVFQVPIHGNVLVLAFFLSPIFSFRFSIGILVSSKANSNPRPSSSPFSRFSPASSSPATSFRAKPCPSSSRHQLFQSRPAITSTSPAASFCAARLSHLWLDGLALYAMGSILLLIAAAASRTKHHGVSFRP